MTAVDWLEVALGSALLLATVYDVFQSVVMPRPAVGRIRFSVTFTRRVWIVWRNVAQRPKRLQTRESALALFAPLVMTVLLILWAFGFILGYALLLNGLHHGLHPDPGSFGGTLFFSAGALLSFSVGSIEPTATSTSFLMTIEAGTGFGLFAIVVSLLFSLFTAFQRRETAVVALDVIAGAPPTGVQLLETCAKFDMPERLTATFVTWQAWTADVLETHLSYPLLFFFRSSHDNEAWSNSFGAVMDAATLVVSAIEHGPEGEALIMYKLGDHFITDMARNLGFSVEHLPGVERHEFDEVFERLHRAGYALRDRDAAWEQFAELRSHYADWLNRVSRNLAATPAPWIGDRSYLPHRDGRPGPGEHSRYAGISVPRPPEPPQGA
ncbi:MAG: hypothetical protein ACREN2_09495 [Candidatus Dormibacteria bacterium]